MKVDFLSKSTFIPTFIVSLSHLKITSKASMLGFYFFEYAKS